MEKEKTMKYQCISTLLAVLFFASLSFGGEISIEKTSYHGWKECYRMSNGEVELIVVADIGPRIIHFGLVDGENLFNVSESQLGVTESDTWIGFGGHRLWIAPETTEYTYYPDMDKLQVEVDSHRITLTAPPEILDSQLRKEDLTFDEIEERMGDSKFRENLRIQKEMVIQMNPDGEVIVEHRAINASTEFIEMAIWPLTVMKQGGFSIFPNPPFAPHGPGHYLPERTIITWSYTDLGDSRIQYMDKYITVQQDPENETKLKLGFSDTQGWAGYAVDDVLFVKYLDYYPEAEYPDMGCSVEMFTNSSMMEIESLGPKRSLKPDDMTSHTERWRIIKTGPIDNQEESIDKALNQAGLLN